MSSTLLACDQLATKAELQQLRDEINNLLGKDSTGAVKDVLSSSSLANTRVGDSLVQDIKLIEDPTHGGAMMLGIIGLGGKQTSMLGSLPGMSKIYSSVKGALAAVGTLIASNASLIADIANLGVGISAVASTHILSGRLEKAENSLATWVGDYSDLYRHLQKANENITQANSNITQLKIALNTETGNVKTLKGDIVTQGKVIKDLKSGFDAQTKNVQTLKTNVHILEKELEGYEQYANAEMGGLKKSIFGLNLSLAKDDARQKKMLKFTQSLGAKVAQLEGDRTELESRFQKFAFTQTFMHLEIQDLQQNLTNIKILSQTQAVKLLARIKELEDNGGSAGVSSNTLKGIADTRTKTLEVMNRMGTTKDDNGIEASPVPGITPISGQDILTGNTGYFDNLYSTLLGAIPVGLPQEDTRINERITNLTDTFNNSVANQVTPTELQTILGNWGVNLTDGINTNTEAAITGALAATVIPVLAQVETQTTPAAIGSAVGAEICNQTANPGSCLNQGLKNPIIDNLSNKLAAMGLGLETVILARILTLEAFLKNAWSATKMDKILNVVNTVLAFHNAVMLSRNLGQTIGDTATIFLEAINVKDHEGNDIDVNDWITKKFAAMASKLLGAGNYAALVKGLNAANRILTAARGMMSALNGIKDALQEGQEIIANRLGEMGNAFLSQGILEDGSYAWMSDNNDFKTPFSKFTNYVTNLTELVEEIGELVEAGTEVQENINDFKEQAGNAKTASEELQETLTTYVQTKQNEENQKESDSESPIIGNLDLIKDET